jgi:hypothetical protein
METDLVDRLFALWTAPPDRHPDPIAAFRDCYADPVLINGSPMPAADLLERARALHEAFDDHVIELVDRVNEGDHGEGPGHNRKVAVAFRHRARHTGVWRTAAGDVAPSGRTVTGLGIDVLTVSHGKITEIWVLADELQRLQQIANVELRPL